MKDRMRITILGSGTCVPHPARFPCSALVQAVGMIFLVDLGPGIIRQILATGRSIHDLDHILLTHFHVDHCADLAPFIFATKYPGFGREKKLALSGGTGIRELYERLNHTYEQTLDMPEELFEILSLPETGAMDLAPAGLRMEWARPQHKPESRAYRITDTTGFTAVFSGDTEYSDALVNLARDADILVCECALPDGHQVPGHASPSVAGTMAARAGVKKLVLTHFYPECDHTDLEAQCRKTYDGPVVLARDLLTL